VEDELLNSVIRVIESGLEIRDEDGANVSKWGNGYNLQYADRGCVEFPTAEEAAKAFLRLVLNRLY